MKDLTYSVHMNQSKMLSQKWKLFSFYAERIRIMSYHKSKKISFSRLWVLLTTM